MGRKRRRSKKYYERLERELAEEKAKDRADSENRQERIKVLWDLDELRRNASKNPKNGKLTERKLKKQKLKGLLESISDSTGNKDLEAQITELIELAGLQDREIEYLMQFRRHWEEIEAHYPERLEDLLAASLFPIFRPGYLAANLPAMPVSQNWEDRRQRYKWSSSVRLLPVKNSYNGTHGKYRAFAMRT